MGENTFMFVAKRLMRINQKHGATYVINHIVEFFMSNASY